MKFAYTAYDKAGRQRTGTLDAVSSDAAAEAARRLGLYAIKLRDAAPDAPSSPSPSNPTRIRHRLKHLASFTRQLAVLVRTGTPLVQAIEAVERQTTDAPFRAVLNDIRTRVEQGESLSAALAAHPAVFDPVSRSLIVAGESGGKLEDMLDSLASLCRQQVRVRSAISGAMVYPILLLHVAAAVILAMITFVLPRFDGLFKNLDSPLPPTTRFLMDAGHAVRNWWFFIIPLFAAAAAALVWWARSHAGRRALAEAGLHTPVFGPIARSFICARICRLLGVLVNGRVPLLDAVALVKGSVANPRYAALLANAEDAVTRGEGLAAVLSASPLVTPAVAEAIRSGEQSGSMGPVLLSVADYLDEDNETTLKSVSSLIEPLILLALGLVVGAVALSMFLPLFDLAAGGGRPGGAP